MDITRAESLFIKYILASSPSLERMLVHYNGTFDVHEALRISLALLMCRWQSPRVKVRYGRATVKSSEDLPSWCFIKLVIALFAYKSLFARRDLYALSFWRRYSLYFLSLLTKLELVGICHALSFSIRYLFYLFTSLLLVSGYGFKSLFSMRYVFYLFTVLFIYLLLITWYVFQ